MNGVCEWQLYRNSDNRLYNKYLNSDTASWFAGDLKGDTLLDVKVTEGVGEVLG
jgi:hypothetical protein